MATPTTVSRRRLTVLLFFLAYISSFLDRQIVAVLGPQIRAAFDLGNLQIGLLYGTAFSVVYALAGIPAGWLADRTDRRALVVGGVATWSAMTVLSGWASSFGFLVACRMVLGLSQALLSPAVYSWLGDAYPAARRAEIYSTYASAIFIGVGLSFLVGGAVSAGGDWRAALIWAGAPGVLLAGAMALVIREPSRPGGAAGGTAGRDMGRPDAARGSAAAWAASGAPESLATSLRSLLSIGAVRLHLAGFALLGCTGYTVLAFLSTFFGEVHGRPDLTTHVGWFFFGVAAMVVLSGRLADRLARTAPLRRYWMGMAAACALPLYLAAFWSPTPGIAFVFLGGALLLGSSYNGVAVAILHQHVPPDRRALATGLYLFVVSVAGFGAGPPIAGWLMDGILAGPDAVRSALSWVVTAGNLGAVLCFWRVMRLSGPARVSRVP